MCKTFIIKVTSSEIYWRVCGMQILPSGHECFLATQDIQLGVWLWNVTKDLFKKGFPRCLLRSVEVSMQTCSPPSLLDASSHWVWYNGYNEECTSSACSPNRLLVSVGRVLRLKKSPEKGHTQESCTHLDLWARCGRPALFVCVQIFREQASDEITEEESNISEHILFIDVTQIKSLLFGNSQFTALHEFNEVREEHVPVSFAESIDIIRHLTKHQTWGITDSRKSTPCTAIIHTCQMLPLYFFKLNIFNHGH